jgi:hypothetical protein
VGTNYYQRTNICECCGRYEERHIGKKSAGWEFSFQGYNEDIEIYSWEDWKKVLKEKGKIFNEYGEEISYEEFVKLVEDSKGGEYNGRLNTNHYDYCEKDGCITNNDWKDPEGHSFSLSDFS